MAVSDNLRGAALMCASMFAFTFNDSLMKSASQSLPLFQAIALRGILVLAGLLLVGQLTGGLRLWPPRSADRVRIALRSLAEVGSTALFLTALQHMPLANISAILQSVPLAVTLGAALFFGESIGWRRMTAIIAGFIGVLIIIRPGGEGFGLWSVLALASVGCVVLRDLVTRGISRDIGSVTISVWAGVAVTTMGLAVSVPQGWAMPDAWTAAKIGGAGLALVGGYMFSVMTMRLGDVGFVAPFRYTSLLWAILLGWIGFGALPDGWTVIGAGIVVGGGLYAFWREAQLRRRAA